MNIIKETATNKNIKNQKDIFFKEIEFKIGIKTHLKALDVFDITLTFHKNIQKSFRKPNDNLFDIFFASNPA